MVVRLVKSSKLQVNFTINLMISVIYSNCYSSVMAKCRPLKKCDNFVWMDNLKNVLLPLNNNNNYVKDCLVLSRIVILFCCFPLVDVYIFLSVCVYLSFCLSVCQSTFLSVCVCLSVFPFIHILYHFLYSLEKWLLIS